MFDRSAREAPAVALVSTYPPRQCGIATFTYDLAHALPAPWTVVAIDEGCGTGVYGPEVGGVIRKHDRASYRRAAEALDAGGLQAVSLQHEFGLFGGEWGEYVLELLEHLRAPVVATLHTSLRRPPRAAREIMEEILRLSAALVVPTRAGAALLREQYGPPRGPVYVVPHGVPDLPRTPGRRPSAKRALGLLQRKVLLTFGLINPGKGIEFALRALPRIAEAHPDVLYLVVGRTHPGVAAIHGEAYRRSLQSLAQDLGVSKHVRFENRYVSQQELLLYLQACDLFLLPYCNPEQAVSGTLAYAMGMGRAVVATPFEFAREALGRGRGALVPFRDAGALARRVVHLLEDRAQRSAIERGALHYTRSWVWPEVGTAYARVIASVTRSHLATERRVVLHRGSVAVASAAEHPAQVGGV
jgi:glycosyltransferase involved in cell wall biosynthesis